MYPRKTFQENPTLQNTTNSNYFFKNKITIHLQSSPCRTSIAVSNPIPFLMRSIQQHMGTTHPNPCLQQDPITTYANSLRCSNAFKYHYTCACFYRTSLHKTTK